MCILMALILPAIPQIVLFSNGGFIINSFPPTGCIGKDIDTIFYGIFLPTIFLCGVGTTLLVFILRKVMRVSFICCSVNHFHKIHKSA